MAKGAGGRWGLGRSAGPQGVLEAAELGHSARKRGAPGRKEGEGNERRGELERPPFSTPHPTV